MEYVKTYLDDLLILTNSSFKHHQIKLEMVLARLSTAGMRVNISKSKFFAEQIEYLGYWITRQGIQPITSFNQLHGYRAIRSTYHTSLQATPCQLVFGRDMIHNIASRANWDQIQKRKQDIIIKSNQKENKSQIHYEYKIGDQVLLETPWILRKLSTPRTGPYPVMNVYKNGTIRVQKGNKKLYQKE
jgi:hypothetical protein